MYAILDCARAENAATGRQTFTCDENGNFAPTQCDDTRCYCVDSSGDRISGSAESTPEEQNTLDCDRRRDTWRGNGVKIFPQTLKIENRHNANFVVTGGTMARCYDNLRTKLALWQLLVFGLLLSPPCVESTGFTTYGSTVRNINACFVVYLHKHWSGPKMGVAGEIRRVTTHTTPTAHCNGQVMLLIWISWFWLFLDRNTQNHEIHISSNNNKHYKTLECNFNIYI